MEDLETSSSIIYEFQFVWKQMVDDLNLLKIIGSAELQERSVEEVKLSLLLQSRISLLEDLSENDGSYDR